MCKIMEDMVIDEKCGNSYTGNREITKEEISEDLTLSVGESLADEL